MESKKILIIGGGNQSAIASAVAHAKELDPNIIVIEDDKIQNQFNSLIEEKVHILENHRLSMVDDMAYLNIKEKPNKHFDEFGRKKRSR